MINPKELRIGNYVEYMGEMKPVLSVDGERNDIEMGLNGTVTLPEYLPNSTHAWTTTGRWCNKINPIPITPEILVSCGFERSKIENSSNVWVKNIGLREFNIASDLVVHNVWMPLYEVNRQGMVHRLAEFCNLHQLQNLIHSLTNQELTFKTTTHE